MSKTIQEDISTKNLTQEEVYSCLKQTLSRVFNRIQEKYGCFSIKGLQVKIEFEENKEVLIEEIIKSCPYQK